MRHNPAKSLVLPFVFVFAVMVSACAATPTVSGKEQPDALTPASKEATATTSNAQKEMNLPSALVEVEDLELITQVNADRITQVAQIEPYFPSYTALSADGRVAAEANLWNVRLLERENGALIMTISADLPECQFGGDRYLSLSADGSFIALVTRSTLQVWQAGGGLVYEAPISRRFSNAPNICGIDMPRLAISPDGRLLAVSGMEYTRESLKSTFRVIDILSNEVVYEWDGSQDKLHGALDYAAGLGFSRDGRVLQTFDPLQMTLSAEDSALAFRFWSTKDWREISAESALIKASYSPGELLYAQSTRDGLEVREKSSGALVKILPDAPCSALNPCQMRFSPKGNWAVLLPTLSGRLPFREALMAERLIRVDMRAGKLLEGPAGFFRDLEGALVGDDGVIVLATEVQEAGIPAGAWWVGNDGFYGLRPLPDGGLLFTPRVYYLPNTSSDKMTQPCPYCAACRLGPPWKGLECLAGLVSDEGKWFSVAPVPETDSLALLDAEGKSVGKLPLPPELAGALPDPYPGAAFGRGLSVKPLGYSEAYQTAFYCLDLDQRLAGCLIAEAGSGSLLANGADLRHLRFSADGERAALFDGGSFQQLFVDLASGRINRRSAFQARAYPAPAYFFKDGQTAAYIIQELNNRANFWLELAAADGSRAQGRVNLKDAGLADPVALSADPHERIWAVGERDGRAALLDFESGALIYAWQAQAGELIGLTFAADGRLLVSLGADRLLRLWGVPH